MTTLIITCLLGNINPSNWAAVFFGIISTIASLIYLLGQRILNSIEDDQLEKKRNTTYDNWMGNQTSGVNKSETRKEKLSKLVYYIIALQVKMKGICIKKDEHADSIIRRYYKSEKEPQKLFDQYQTLFQDVNTINIDKICDGINLYFNFAAKSEIIMELLSAAYADNVLKDDKYAMIQNIIEKINISNEDFQTICAIFHVMHRHGYFLTPSDFSINSITLSKQDALNIFGVDCYNETNIKKAFHALTMKYYPDTADLCGYESEHKISAINKIIRSAHDLLENSKKNTQKETTYKDSILVLLAEVMKADGKQMVCELDKIKVTICRYYESVEMQTEALKNFKDILGQTTDLKEVYQAVNESLGYVAKSELIMELLAVAYADDHFSDKEYSCIQKISRNLNISTSQFESIYTLFIKKHSKGFYKDKDSQQSDSKDYNNRNSYDCHQHIKSPVDEAYTVLGLNSKASNEEIKKAYRALVKEYHPDKYSALDNEAIRQATETMKQINVAWDVVKLARGIK